MSRPRVLIITGQLGLGGAERELVTFLEGGAAEVLDLHVISLAKGGEFRQRIERVLGRPVQSPPWKGRVGRAFWVRRVLADVAPDLIHSWNLFPMFYLWLTRARRKSPLVGFLQQTPDQAIGESRWPWLYRFLVDQTDALVSNSQAALDETVKMGVRKPWTIVVHNAVSRSFFDAEPSEGALHHKGDGIAVVGLGRLIQRKRGDWMIRATAMIPSMRLWLVGDGPERPRLERMAGDLGIRSRVKFWGTVKDPAPLLAAADVLAHCAWAEGLPNAVQEAMAVGLPVVVSAVSGVPEIITHGEDGLLFPCENFDMFVSHLSRLVTDQQLRKMLGKMARRKAERDFSPAVMTQRIVNFYWEILEAFDGTVRRGVARFTTNSK